MRSASFLSKISDVEYHDRPLKFFNFCGLHFVDYFFNFACNSQIFEKKLKLWWYTSNVKNNETFEARWFQFILPVKERVYIRRTKRKQRVRPGNSLYFFNFFFYEVLRFFWNLAHLKLRKSYFFLIFEICDVTIFKYEKNTFLCRNFGNFGSKSRAGTGLFLGFFKGFPF